MSQFHDIGPLRVKKEIVPSKEEEDNYIHPNKRYKRKDESLV